MKNVIAILIIFGIFCSAHMAVNDRDAHNFGVTENNTAREKNGLQQEVPEKSTQVSNDVSAGQAAGHAVMYVLTLGVWEVIGTPIEGFQGNKRQAQVQYGENDRITDVKGNAQPPI